MLGERIALLRRGQGWSQAALAQKLHISPSAVGMYEQGRREPSLEAIVQMAQVFSVSADYLLTGKPLSRQDELSMDRCIQAAVAASGADLERLSQEERAVLLAALMTEA